MCVHTCVHVLVCLQLQKSSTATGATHDIDKSMGVSKEDTAQLPQHRFLAQDEKEVSGHV